MEPGCTAHMGPIRVPTLDPYGSHIDCLLGFSNARFLRSLSVPEGGGVSFFSACVGSSPASTFHPQKYQEFQAPKFFLPEPTYI